MSYYTSYGLTTYGDIQECQAFEQALLEYTKDGYGNVNCEVEELVDTGGAYAKLYDLRDWITELAPKFPNVLIILSGDGEESDDLWEQRWKGEETEYQEAAIPPFKNKNLLTEYEIKKPNN